MNTYGCGKYMKIKPGTSQEKKDSLLKKQGQENWPPTRKNILEGHPLGYQTEIELKTRHFAHGALSPPSPLRWTSSQHSAGHRKRLLRPHFSLLQRLPAGAVRQPCSSQLGRSPVTLEPEPLGA